MSDDQAGQKRPSDITCRELTTLDTRAVPGVVYYISGYSKGEKDGSAASAGMSDRSASSAASDKSASNKAGSSQSASAGSSSAAGGSASASSGTSQSGSSQSGATSGNPTVMAVPGYYQIPVQEVLVTCRETPESRAADVIEQKGSQG